MSRKKLSISELDLSTIGGRIAYIRLSNGLKQQDFADITGISKGGISCFENHKYDPSYQALVKIIEKFDINPGWLLAGKGEMIRQIPEESNRSDTANLSSIDKKHAELIMNFKDKTAAREINKDLLEIEAANPNAFREAAAYIKGLARGVQLSKPDLSKGKKTA